MSFNGIFASQYMGYPTQNFQGYKNRLKSWNLWILRLCCWFTCKFVFFCFFFLWQTQKKEKGYTVAKYYFKVGEYTSALNWVTRFVEVRENSAPALKLAGQCYEKQKQFDRALQFYQRSLQADPKQSELIDNGKKFIFFLLILLKKSSKSTLFLSFSL